MKDQEITPEERALGAFLSAMYDQRLDGAKMREAMLKVLGIAAPKVLAPVAYMVKGSDATKVWAKKLEWTIEGAKNTASVFAQHYPTVNTTSLYAEPQALAPLTKTEIKDLTAMVFGAPCTDEILEWLPLVIAQYEVLIAANKRPVDPVEEAAQEVGGTP